MRNSKKKNNNITPIVFQIWSDELKNRADAYFYQPIFKELYKTLQTSKYSISKLSKIIDGDLIKGILPNQEEKGGDVNIVQISSVGRDGIIDVSDCITAKREVYDEKHILKRNDILVVITGATIGKVGFWQEDKPNYYLGGDIVKFQVKKDFDPIFTWAYLRSELGQKQILQHITGATNKHLSPDDVINIQIPLLPIEKQKKVSATVQEAYEQKKNKEVEILKILSSIDDFVLGELGIDMPEGGAERVFQIWSDEIEGRIDALFYKPYLRSLLEQIKNKKHFTLGEAIAEMSGGATPKVTGDYYLDEGGVPFLRVQNITEMGINLDDVKFIKPEVHETMLKRSQLEKDDLVFTITGRIGSVAVVPDNFEGNINQHSVRFHLQDEVEKTKVMPEYVSSFFNTKIGRELSFRSTTGGTRPALDYEALKKLIVPLPSIAKQEKIVAGVKTIYEKAKHLRQEAESIVAGAEKQIEQMILA